MKNLRAALLLARDHSRTAESREAEPESKVGESPAIESKPSGKEEKIPTIAFIPNSPFQNHYLSVT